MRFGLHARALADWRLNMQEIFEMIYYPDDILKTLCALIILVLMIELIFGVISMISHAIKGAR